MDLTTITKVASSDREVDINEKLREGWVLLATAAGKDEQGQPYIRYSIGFPGRDAIE